jgi:hypothetical protein
VVVSGKIAKLVQSVLSVVNHEYERALLSGEKKEMAHRSRRSTQIGTRPILGTKSICGDLRHLWANLIPDVL